MGESRAIWFHYDFVCFFFTFYNFLKHIVKPCEARRVYSSAVRCTFSFIIHMVFFSELKACLSLSLDSGNRLFFLKQCLSKGRKRSGNSPVIFPRRFSSEAGVETQHSIAVFPKFIHPNPAMPLLLFSSCFPPCHLILSHLYFSMTPFAKIVAHLSKWVKEWRSQWPGGRKAQINSRASSRIWGMDNGLRKNCFVSLFLPACCLHPTYVT